MKISPIAAPADCERCPALACVRLDWQTSEGPRFALLCLTHAQRQTRTLRETGQDIDTPEAVPLPGRDEATTSQPPPPMGPPRVSRSTWRAVDGDTIEETKPCGCKRRIRLLGVDAPERGTDAGAEAAEATRELLDEASGDITEARDNEHPDRDRYGRDLRWVNAAGHIISIDLVTDGLAPVDRRFPLGQYAQALEAAEAAAKSAHRGIWRQA